MTPRRTTRRCSTREGIGPEPLGDFRVKLDGPRRALRARAVHDDRRRRRRQALAAAVLRRVRARRRRGRLRVLRPARPDHPVHDAALAASGGPADADDRPQGPLPSPWSRTDRPHAPVRLYGHRHRPVHLDDPRDPRAEEAAEDRRAARRLVRRRARIPGASSNAWSATGPTPGPVRAHRQPAGRPPQRRLDRSHRPRGGGHAGVCRDLGLARTGPSSTSAATPR